MVNDIKGYLKEILSYLDEFIVSSWMFGSYLRNGKRDNSFNDIDIAIISEKNIDSGIIDYIRRLFYKLTHYKLDVVVLSRSEVIDRVSYGDYLLASILQPSEFIYGDLDFYTEMKRTIFNANVDENSIKRNIVYGVYFFDLARLKWESLKHINRILYVSKILDYNKYYEMVLNNTVLNMTEDLSEKYKNLYIEVLETYSWSLGYLMAAKVMKETKKVVSFDDILDSNLVSDFEKSVLLETINLKKKIKKGYIPKISEISMFIERIKSYIKSYGVLNELEN